MREKYPRHPLSFQSVLLQNERKYMKVSRKLWVYVLSAVKSVSTLLKQLTIHETSNNELVARTDNTEKLFSKDLRI